MEVEATAHTRKMTDIIVHMFVFIAIRYYGEIIHPYKNCHSVNDFSVGAKGVVMRHGRRQAHDKKA